MSNIPENIIKIEAIVNTLGKEEKEIIEKHLSEKNNVILQLQDGNKKLLLMLSDVFELIQNIDTNTKVSIKGIYRILSPILQQNKPTGT